MARRTVEREREDIAGFWTRAKGTELAGRVVKFVETENGGFWILRATSDGAPLQGKEEGTVGQPAKKGQLVGVSGSFGLTVLEDMVNQKVYLTSNGKVNHPKKKGMKMWDIKVEVDDGDDGSTQPEGSTPF